MANNEKSLQGVMDIIEAHKAAKAKERDIHWQGGTLLEYLERVKENPGLVETAHERVYRVVIQEPGQEEVFARDNPRLKRALGLEDDESMLLYKAFKDFYGIEESIEGVASYLFEAAQKGEAYRQFLCPIGPVGSGKSSIVEMVKLMIEGEVIYIPEGCEKQDNPLWLLPRSERSKFEKELGVEIEPNADVCGACSYRLTEEFEGDFTRFPIIKKSISKRKQVGVASVTPVELENADISVLIGSLNVSELHRYPEGHPKTVIFNGVYHKAGSGILEYIEAFEMPKEYLNPLITATQEKQIGSPGRQPLASVDLVIIAHSNEEAMDRFFADPTNKKFKDRMIIVYVPYNVRLDEEVEIYKKLIRRSKFWEYHIAPHTIEFVSLVSVLSRIKESEICPDLMVKASILNGEDLSSSHPNIDVKAFREENLRNSESALEGMDGISYRFIAKVLDHAFSYFTRRGRKCINALQVRRSLIKKMEQAKDIYTNKELLERYARFIEDAFWQVYRKKALDDFARVFISIKQEFAESLFQRYLDQAQIYMEKAYGNKKAAPEADMDFLESIEKEGAGLTDKQSAISFRRDILAYAEECHKENRPLHYYHYQPIKKAIERLLRDASLKFLKRIPKSDRIRSPEQEQEYNAMIQKLQNDEFGYCEHCAPVLIDWLADYAIA